MLSVDQSAGVPADVLGRLVRRARLLAADTEIAGAGLRITSSAKLSRRGDGEVLWVAEAGAVGGDSDAAWAPVSGTGREALTGLPLDRVHAALVDGALDGAPHPPALAGCATGALARACPPEALLHAVVPATHVDVAQPDAAMALCAAANGARLARTCFGGQAAWVPYEATGAALARELGRAVAEPGVRLALLARRGLVTWGETEEGCREATVAAARRARAFVAAAALGPSCGGTAPPLLDARERASLLVRLLPVLRRALGSSAPRVLELDGAPEVLGFLCARDAPTLVHAGAVCAPQALHTQRVPLWVDADPRCDDTGDLAERIVRGAGRHRARMRWEAAAFGGAPAAQRDADARVVLIAGVGMVAAGATRTHARRARRAFRHAIATLEAVAALDRFVAPSAVECAAFERALRAS